MQVRMTGQKSIRVEWFLPGLHKGSAVDISQASRRKLSRQIRLNKAKSDAIFSYLCVSVWRTKYRRSISWVHFSLGKQEINIKLGGGGLMEYLLQQVRKICVIDAREKSDEKNGSGLARNMAEKSLKTDPYLKSKGVIIEGYGVFK